MVQSREDWEVEDSSCALSAGRLDRLGFHFLICKVGRLTIHFFIVWFISWYYLGNSIAHKNKDYISRPLKICEKSRVLALTLGQAHFNPIKIKYQVLVNSSKQRLQQNVFWMFICLWHLYFLGSPKLSNKKECLIVR